MGADEQARVRRDADERLQSLRMAVFELLRPQLRCQLGGCCLVWRFASTATPFRHVVDVSSHVVPRRPERESGLRHAAPAGGRLVGGASLSDHVLLGV